MTDEVWDDGDGVGGRPMQERGFASSGPVLTERAFWGIFALAWTAYGALYCSVVFFGNGRPFGMALLEAAAALCGPGLPAVGVALKRRDLLSPDRSLAHTIGLQVMVGVAYALTATVVGTLVFTFLPVQEASGEFGDRPGLMALARMVNALLLFMVLLGFLMWTSSLERIQESRALAAREAVLRARAEAKAVRAQFNPHFVFNTLHSLMLLVRADPETAERAIEDVAELIRYASTLQRREVDQVTLDKELELARRYVSLEKLRLADRLTVEWAVDEELGDALVPALSLQTLLENAIRHGISPRTRGGHVRIGAARLDGGLTLSVEDDGCGADPARVGASEGRGLDLLEQRLATVYGRGASLCWRTASGEGFSATLRIPLRRFGAPERAADE